MCLGPTIEMLGVGMHGVGTHYTQSKVDISGESR
jgi:hypothetical protein